MAIDSIWNVLDVNVQSKILFDNCFGVSIDFIMDKRCTILIASLRIQEWHAFSLYIIHLSQNHMNIRLNNTTAYRLHLLLNAVSLHEYVLVCLICALNSGRLLINQTRLSLTNRESRMKSELCVKSSAINVIWWQSFALQKKKLQTKSVNFNISSSWNEYTVPSRFNADSLTASAVNTDEINSA